MGLDYISNIILACHPTLFFESSSLWYVAAFTSIFFCKYACLNVPFIFASKIQEEILVIGWMKNAKGIKFSVSSIKISSFNQSIKRYGRLELVNLIFFSCFLSGCCLFISSQLLYIIEKRPDAAYSNTFSMVFAVMYKPISAVV